MMSFLCACVVLAVMIAIGGFLLNLIIVAIGLLIAGALAAWEKLTGG